jgi:hypothetical protein
VTAGQSFPVSEAAAPGLGVGTVLATDPDAATVFSQWQLTDTSGKFAIDAATGSLSLAAGAALDFETATSYSVSVSVWDGYVRSAAVPLTITVTNANDNAPAITAGQAFRIDDGYKQIIAALEVSDPDDVNQIGFTHFSNWSIVSGDPAHAFALTTNGELKVFPKRINWRLTGYALGATVSDGANTSTPATVLVAIPSRVYLCFGDIIQIQVPKQSAAAFVALGADLGRCRFFN